MMASPRKFLFFFFGGGGGVGGGGGYVNLEPLILDNTRTLVNALQKQNSWKLVG